MERPLGVILERSRRPECRHYCVAGELLDGPTGALDLGRHRVVEAVEQRTRALRILRVGERGRADEVGEDDGRELALLGRRRVPHDGRRARRTELGFSR